MGLEKIKGGWFDREAHAFYDEQGKWVPSATQVIRLAGLSDFSMVDPEVLAAKQQVGTDVHDLTVDYDRNEDIDPTWISERAAPYFEAYKLFRIEKDFVPNPDFTETPIVGKVFGMSIGLIPDRFGKYKGHDAVCELKCVEIPMASWGYQTCFQELVIYKSNRCGRSMRFAVQLLRSGKYKLDPHTDHTGDQNVAVAALTVVHARLRNGEKVWQKL